MKILLVNPTGHKIGMDHFLKAPPLGLMILAATVPDHEVEILDLRNYNYPEGYFEKKVLNPFHKIFSVPSVKNRGSHLLKFKQPSLIKNLILESLPLTNRCGVTIRRFEEVLRSLAYYAFRNIIYKSKSKGNLSIFF